MKKLVILVALTLGALLGYNLVTTGELRLSPLQVMSAEELAVHDLEGRLEKAAGEMRQAGRSAGLGGIDTSSQVEAALAELSRLKKDAVALRNKVESQASRDRLDGLVAEIGRLTGS